jgi:predicted ATPase/DNA-binding CsgD family transcriptional regulator
VVAPGGVLDTARHNIPPQPTQLIGRREQVSLTRQLLLRDDVRLVTLVGPPGVGKTRLALAVATELSQAFIHGIWFVDLSLCTDPSSVPSAIAQVLGVSDTGDRPVVERLTDHLQDRHLALVLDNFEHLVPAASDLPALLASCRGLQVLATSREPLRLRWELIQRVAPLSLPRGPNLPRPDELQHVESVALFVQRAQAIKPDFVLNQANSPAVAEICVRLDGLPLAIELAAGWSTVLTPPELLERIERRLPLLRWGAQDVPQRHQTLRAAIGLSFDSLEAPLQAFFRRIAVFVGGWTLEAAEAVGRTGEDGLDLLEAVRALVQKSLVQPATEAGGGPRFQLLETIREYGVEHLATSGDLDPVREKHAAYFLALAEQAESEVTGPEQRTWIRRLEQEHDNLRAALKWAAERGQPDIELRLASALAPFWWGRGYLVEGRRWLEGALARGSGALPSLRVRAVGRCGWLAHGQGDFDRALELHEECLRLGQSLGDALQVAQSLTNLGIVAKLQGQQPRAASLLEAGLAASLEAGDTWGAALALRHLGALAHMQRAPERAAGLYRQSVTLFREVGDKRSIANALTASAEVARDQGQAGEAAALLSEALILCSEIGDRGWTSAHCMIVAVTLTAERGEAERVARLLGMLDALREVTSATSAPEERAAQEQAIDILKSRLGDQPFAAARADGRSLAPDQAVAEALSMIADVSANRVLAQRAASRRPTRLLSDRESQVLRLVADGRSTRQIAESLIITERTATFHVTSILNKLGADTRAHAVALAARRGLLGSLTDSPDP